jgi:hypothetical protein
LQVNSFLEGLSWQLTMSKNQKNKKLYLKLRNQIAVDLDQLSELKTLSSNPGTTKKRGTELTSHTTCDVISSMLTLGTDSLR